MECQSYAGLSRMYQKYGLCKTQLSAAYKTHLTQSDLKRQKKKKYRLGRLYKANANKQQQQKVSILLLMCDRVKCRSKSTKEDHEGLIYAKGQSS